MEVRIVISLSHIESDWPKSMPHAPNGQSSPASDIVSMTRIRSLWCTHPGTMCWSLSTAGLSVKHAGCTLTKNPQQSSVSSPHLAIVLCAPCGLAAHLTPVACFVSGSWLGLSWTVVSSEKCKKSCMMVLTFVTTVAWGKQKPGYQSTHSTPLTTTIHMLTHCLYAYSR